MQPEAEVLAANLKSARDAVIKALDGAHLSRDHGENLLAFIIGASRASRGVEPINAKLEKSLAMGYLSGLATQAKAAAVTK